MNNKIIAGTFAVSKDIRQFAMRAANTYVASAGLNIASRNGTVTVIPPVQPLEKTLVLTLKKGIGKPEYIVNIRNFVHLARTLPNTQRNVSDRFGQVVAADSDVLTLFQNSHKTASYWTDTVSMEMHRIAAEISLYATSCGVRYAEVMQLKQENDIHETIELLKNDAEKYRENAHNVRGHLKKFNTKLYVIVRGADAVMKKYKRRQGSHNIEITRLTDSITKIKDDIQRLDELRKRYIQRSEMLNTIAQNTLMTSLSIGSMEAWKASADVGGDKQLALKATLPISLDNKNPKGAICEFMQSLSVSSEKMFGKKANVTMMISELSDLVRNGITPDEFIEKLQKIFPHLGKYFKLSPQIAKGAAILAGLVSVGTLIGSVYYDSESAKQLEKIEKQQSEISALLAKKHGLSQEAEDFGKLVLCTTELFSVAQGATKSVDSLINIWNGVCADIEEIVRELTQAKTGQIKHVKGRLESSRETWKKIKTDIEVFRKDAFVNWN